MNAVAGEVRIGRRDGDFRGEAQLLDGGISNPLEVMEQITRLLFIRRLDGLQMVEERVFPVLRELGGDVSTYEQDMRDARFTAPTPALPARVVEQRVHSEQRRIQQDLSASALPCGTTSW